MCISAKIQTEIQWNLPDCLILNVLFPAKLYNIAPFAVLTFSNDIIIIVNIDRTSEHQKFLFQIRR